MLPLNGIMWYVRLSPEFWAAAASRQVTEPVNVHTPAYLGAVTENKRLAIAAPPLGKISC